MQRLFILTVNDSFSFALTLGIVGIVVVFLALQLLVVILNNIPRIGDFFTGLMTRKKPVQPESKSQRIPAQVSAAISVAIYLYLDDIHDKETRVMTIRKVSRTYSPWSSKIYGLNIFRK
ncbi:MAG TPA: OadG family protein [Bacteroidales bacterium]|nr:OadG family protein [Bacteroidales bacterium]